MHNYKIGFENLFPNDTLVDLAHQAVLVKRDYHLRWISL